MVLLPGCKWLEIVPGRRGGRLSLLSLVRNGVNYISYQPSKNEISRLAERIASIANQLEPKPGLLIVIEHEYIEVYN